MTLSEDFLSFLLGYHPLKCLGVSLEERKHLKSELLGRYSPLVALNVDGMSLAF